MCISSALKCGRYYRPKVGSLTEFKKDGFFKAINIKTLSEGLRGTSNNSILKNWCLLISIGCIHKRHDKSN